LLPIFGDCLLADEHQPGLVEPPLIAGGESALLVPARDQFIAVGAGPSLAGVKVPARGYDATWIGRGGYAR
jgi:hypothetical protein